MSTEEGNIIRCSSEEDLNSSLASDGDTLDERCRVKVSKTSADLARQVSTCLVDRSPMLERQKKQVDSLCISGSPILFEGHLPQLHGLPKRCHKPGARWSAGCEATRKGSYVLKKKRV
jgi:hypothetical protein